MRVSTVIQSTHISRQNHKEELTLIVDSINEIEMLFRKPSFEIQQLTPHIEALQHCGVDVVIEVND